jgi:hypothetical protein
MKCCHLELFWVIQLHDIGQREIEFQVALFKCHTAPPPPPLSLYLYRIIIDFEEKVQAFTYIKEDSRVCCLVGQGLAFSISRQYLYVLTVLPTYTDPSREFYRIHILCRCVCKRIHCKFIISQAMARVVPVDITGAAVLCVRRIRNHLISERKQHAMLLSDPQFH